jgi:hypothetical protein
MANKKYEHLIKPLIIGLTKWDKATPAIGPGNANQEIRLNGQDHLEGLNLNFSWGVHRELGDWHAGLDPHVHPYPECLIFAGLDTANVNYLGAEIDCCLGAEQETYTFNEPTLIVIPSGLPHGPITTKRMYSPKGFGFWAVELNSVPEISWLGEGAASLTPEQRESLPSGMKFSTAEKTLPNKPTQATGKYAHLVKSLQSGILIERGKLKTGEKLGPGHANHLVWMNGKNLEGLNVNLFWGFCSQPGIWSRTVGSHTHPSDEVLVYLGLDPNNIDNLGAEIEIDMGSEHERHLFNKSTVVVCPAGTPHTPQVTRWVDKPFAFFAVSLSGEHETKSFE